MYLPDPDPDGRFAPPHVSLDDAELTYQELDERYSWFDRFPEWRVLTQADVWFTANREAVSLDSMDVLELHTLRTQVRSIAPALHALAALDEEYATSSAMRWVHQTLGVPFVSEVHPLVWLDATTMMRGLTERIVYLEECQYQGYEDQGGCDDV